MTIPEPVTVAREWESLDNLTNQGSPLSWVWNQSPGREWKDKKGPQRSIRTLFVGEAQNEWREAPCSSHPNTGNWLCLNTLLLSPCSASHRTLSIFLSKFLLASPFLFHFFSLHHSAFPHQPILNVASLYSLGSWFQLLVPSCSPQGGPIQVHEREFSASITVPGVQ